MFYVYEVRIKDTGEVIYVGKGTGNRYKAKKKNDILNRLIEENECEYVIAAQYVTEEEAFEAERQRIIELKSIGQARCNKITELTGGRANWTAEKRKQWSENNPMKAPEQRRRMSEKNPMKNPDISKKVTEKKKLKFVIGDRTYHGLQSAADEYGVTIQSVSYWLDNGRTAKGEPCYRITETAKSNIPIKSIETSHTIIYDGAEYPSIKAAAIAAGVSRSTIKYWLPRGYSTSGVVCRYKDDKTEHQYVNLKSANSAAKRAFEVDGVQYDSILAASKATGYSAKMLPYYALHAAHPPVKCNYVNQQPSGTNFDNSSAEGSTTNG